MPTPIRVQKVQSRVKPSQLRHSGDCRTRIGPFRHPLLKTFQAGRKIGLFFQDVRRTCDGPACSEAFRRAQGQINALIRNSFCAPDANALQIQSRHRASNSMVLSILLLALYITAKSQEKW
jgi:hypothetical protein